MILKICGISIEKNQTNRRKVSPFKDEKAGVVFIMIIANYICSYIVYRSRLEDHIFFPSSLVIDLCHIFSDICFLYYTRSIPTSNFTDVFIYIHAVTGILGAIYFVCFIIFYISADDFCCEPIKIISSRYFITITFIHIHAVT